MPPPLTLARALTTWVLDVPTLVVVAAAAVGYLRAARRRVWPVRRTAAFVAALLVAVLCTCSFLGAYDRVLFWARAVQNIVLLMGVPLLAAAGAPGTLARTTASAGTSARLRTLGAGRAARVLAFPPTATVAVLAPLPVLYLTGLYEATLTSRATDTVVRGALVVCGFVYYSARLRADPSGSGTRFVTSFALSFAETIVDGLLGVLVWLGPLIAAAHYAQVGRTWGPSLRADQTAGAVVLWFGGDVIGIAYLALLLGAWVRSDARAARRVDAELDARAVAASPTADAAPPAMQDGLWWHSDPRFADRPDLRGDGAG